MLFEPQITRGAAARRHSKWKLAVQRSFALAELTADLEGDSEARAEAAEAAEAAERKAASSGGGGGGAAAAPAGPDAP
jgi:hypothetical protein